MRSVHYRILRSYKDTPHVWSSGTFHWYEYGDYCWIRYNPDSDSGIGWVANYQGKILYCDAPVEETTYTISAIAGATGYCLTDRPAGTTGNGYLGDLLVTQDNLTTIHGVVSNLGSAADYYTVLRIVNGEYRYYIMCTYPNRTQYFVCNTSGQLFYALRDEVTDDGSTDSGSSFDATEVITAINSVYSAINSMSSNVGSRLATLINSTNGIGAIVENLATNVVTGFTGVQEQLSTLSSYFSDLSGLFPVQEEITLLGSDTRVAWDSADRITDVKLSGFTDDLIVKEHAGDLVNESGYENVSLSDADTEYKLTTDDNGYRRITAQNEYPKMGTAVPEETLFYFTFDETLASNVGNYSLIGYQTITYADGINGKAYVFNGLEGLTSSKEISRFLSSDNGAFSFAFWFMPKAFPTTADLYSVRFGGNNGRLISVSFDTAGNVGWRVNYGGSNANGWYGGTVSLNQWNHFAFCYDGTTAYGFVNGVLSWSQNIYSNSGISGYLNVGSNKVVAGSMIDDLILVDGVCLWSSSFNSEREGVFGEVAADYFLPCSSQSMTLNFNDEYSVPFTPTDVLGAVVSMGRIEDDFSYIYRDVEDGVWKCHDVSTQNQIILSADNQAILDDTIYIKQNYTMVKPDQITADAMQSLLPVDKPVYLDMPENAKITITYDHYSGWFRMMYLLMDKQTKLLSDLEIVNTTVNETIINVENTVVDITQDNDAFSIFYVEKTDGTTESVGDAAKDAAVFVGDILSMFYRLVFDDALDNVGILKDFEGVYSNTEVSVW